MPGIPKLDLKDRKILYELDGDSRQSFARLGKKVGLSKEVVNYRVHRLMHEGVIKQFTALINVGKLGYISFRPLFRFQNLTPKKEKEIIEYLKARPMVNWLVSVEGNWHLAMWCCAKSMSEFNAFYREFFRRYGAHIEGESLTIFTRVWYFRRSYLLGKAESSPTDIFITEPEETEVDEVDLAILRILAPNARAPVIEIAEKTGISPKTVENRIKKMKSNGLIVNFRTVFDLGKLGMEYYKLRFILSGITPEKLKALRTYARMHPNIVYDNEIMGDANFGVDVQVENNEKLRELIEDVRSRFPDIIRGYEVLKYYKEHKLLFMPIVESGGNQE